VILPGFPVLTSRRPPIRFVASATSTGANITIPAAARAGDFCLIADLAVGSPPASATPSGFTQISTEITSAFGNVKSIFSRKTLVDGDPGTAVTGMNDSSNSKIALVFRPRQGTWGSPTQTGGQGSNGAVSNQTIGTTPAPYIAFGYWAGNVAPVRGFSVAHDGEVSNGDRFLRWKIFNEAPSSITLTCDSGTGGWRIMRSVRVPLTL
jgi:hypothetical protein